jgi:hypothetical protein
MIKIKNLLKISMLLVAAAFSTLSMADQDAVESLSIKASEKNTDESANIKIESFQLGIATVENVNLIGKENTASENAVVKKIESIIVGIKEAVFGINANSNSTVILENKKEKKSFASTSAMTEAKKVEDVSETLNLVKVNKKYESGKEVILSKQFDSRLHFSSNMTLYENKVESKAVAEGIAKAWQIQNGEVISDAVGKWAALSGWGVPIWETQELMSTSNVVLFGTIEEAIQQMVDSFERQGIVLRVTFYSENKVIRIRQGNL